MAAQAKLYTEDDIRQAMVVGVGLGGEEGTLPPENTMENVGKALDIFRESHGRVVPNFEHFRALLERREYRSVAEGHLAAAEMLTGSESMRHAALGQLAATIELLGELRDAAQTVARP